MKLYATQDPSLRVSFEEALFQSMPRGKGLYMPFALPRLSPDFMKELANLSFRQIAFEVSKALLQGVIPEKALEKIVEETLSFDAPLVNLRENTYVLELFHGPSLAFKDFGARFMSRVMSYFLQESTAPLDVLVATSGDTGGAVALGFADVPGTRVTILFPRGKVSPIQELQLTTNGANIHALAVEGTFDDCQAMVKAAFSDEELHRRFRLTSANSINISRLIPQTFYYFHAYAQLLRQGISKVVFTVPSGNFGNIGAGLMAQRMGLPVHRWVAATNANDVVPRFLSGQSYETRKSVQTISNAMDVGAPSNWERIMDLFSGNKKSLSDVLNAYRFSDVETREAMEMLFDHYQYIACPHTAVAWLGMEADRAEHPGEEVARVILSTAHACKFPEVLPDRVKQALVIPSQVEGLVSKEARVTPMAADFFAFKSYLLNR